MARFQAEARAAIAAVERRGRRALLVGGTGLYLRAVVDDLRFPPEDRELRDLIDARYPGDDGLARAYTDLELRDQTAASRIEPGNRRRIMRALEVIQSTGRPFSSFGAGLTGPLDAGGPGAHRRHRRRPVGDRRTDRRPGCSTWSPPASSTRSGASRRLPGPAPPARPSGTRRCSSTCAATIESLDVALMAVETRTRRFARRQEAWFRRDHRIEWFGDGTKTPPDADAVMAWWNGP